MQQEQLRPYARKFLTMTARHLMRDFQRQNPDRPELVRTVYVDAQKHAVATRGTRLVNAQDVRAVIGKLPRELLRD